jgi:hypothetical protein
MFDYSISTVIAGELILVLIIIWGGILFPLLCRILGEKQSGNDIEECSQVSMNFRQGRKTEIYANLFSNLSMAAAALLAVSFVLH